MSLVCTCLGFVSLDLASELGYVFGGLAGRFRVSHVRVSLAFAGFTSGSLWLRASLS